MERFDTKELHLAVVGQFRSGKTTWISSFFTEDIQAELLKICKGNTEGQTKLSTLYRLKNTQDAKEKLAVDEITFNHELLAQLICKHFNIAQKETPAERTNTNNDTNTDNTKDHNLNDKTVAFLHEIGYDLDSFKQYTDCDDVLEAVKNYNLVIPKEVSENPYNLIDRYTNEDAILETEIISNIIISGPVKNDVKEIFQANGIESLVLHDTRGFVDDTADYIERACKKDEELHAQYEKNPSKGNQKLLQAHTLKLMKDRCIFDVDAYVFMTAGNDSIVHSKYRKAYGSMIKAMAAHRPIFVVGREERLVDLTDTDKTYEEFVKEIRNNTRKVRSTDTVQELLKDLGMFEDDKDYGARIAQKHYNTLYIANVQDISDEARTRSSMCSLKEIIMNTKEYLKDLNDAGNRINNLGEQIFNKLAEAFNQCFNQTVHTWRDFNPDYYNSELFIVNPLRPVREIAEHIAYSPYNASEAKGMVGPRYGITTRVPGKGRSGDYAIIMLMASYEILNNIIEYIVEHIDLSVLPEFNNASEEEIDNTKVNLTETLKRLVESRVCGLYSTPIMLSTRYLQKACNKAKEECGASYNDSAKKGEELLIGKYDQQLANYLNYDDTKPHHNIHCLSLAKSVLWYVVSQCWEEMIEEAGRKQAN